MKRTITLIVTGALAVGALTACGSAAKPTTTTTKAKTAATTTAPKPNAYAVCSAALQPLISAETNLDSRLNTGMQFSAYTTAVGDVSVAYSALVVPTAVNCATVGLPFQQAFQDYQKALNTWNGCIQSTSCTSTNSIKPQLQADWSAASAQIMVGQSVLQSLSK